MEFLPFPNQAKLLSDLPAEDESFIMVLRQKKDGEINEIQPADYYDVYLVRDGQYVWMWCFQSLKDFIHLVKRGNTQEPLKDQPIITWLTRVFYPETLPEENRAEFIRRMNTEGLTF